MTTPATRLDYTESLKKTKSSVVAIVFPPLWSTLLCSAKMPQLNGGGGDDLGANDEMISFKDEGEQEEKISENVSAERDLDDVKSSLVNESESSSDSEVRPLALTMCSAHTNKS